MDSCQNKTPKNYNKNYIKKMFVIAFSSPKIYKTTLIMSQVDTLYET
jgi:hypothetical protein